MINVYSSFSNAVIATGTDYKKSEKFNPFFENAGKLNLVVSFQIKEQYSELSKWEKLFVANFYGKNNNNIVIEKPNQKEIKYDQVREDIQNELNRLYAIADDEEYFSIDTNDNKFLERAFESQIKVCISRGQESDAELLQANKQIVLKDIANKYAETQKNEYKHIVDYINSSDYEPAFKVLMLRETLLQTYKQIKEGNDTKTIVEKRVQHKTLTGHMTLNNDVLSTIYNNLDNYSSFANLYFAGIAISNKTMSKQNEISLDGINTFGKGKWLKFEGKSSDKEKYIQNAQALSALVQNTPWCTKQLAASQLEEGDFFVFVDNENKPHIAVKMKGNRIDEVRGIKNDFAQELEEDYRPIALEFLTKNKNLKNGKEWLNKEEWNKRLIIWKNKIDNGETLSNEEINQILYDSFYVKDFKAHMESNSNTKELKKSLAKIKNQLANFYGCKEDDICFSDFSDQNATSPINNYFIILNNAEFSEKTNDIGNLQFIGGEADFSDSQITSLGNLQSIGGDTEFGFSQITNLGNLQSIGGDAYFTKSQITSLGNLQSIGGTADFKNSQITDLGNLQKIGGTADFRNSQITDFGKLKEIHGRVFLENNLLLQEKFKKEFYKDEKTGKFIRKKEFLPKNDKNLGEGMQ